VLGLRHAENVHYQYSVGILDERALLGAIELAHSIAEFDSNREVWDDRKRFHPEGFVTWMEMQISAAWGTI